MNKQQSNYVKKFNAENPDYEIVGEYLGTDKEVCLLHKVCGNTYLSTLHKFKRSKRITNRSGNCPFCLSENKKRYSVENPSQDEEIREKSQQTSLKNYGTKNPGQSEKIKEKMQQTCLERYGEANYFQQLPQDIYEITKSEEKFIALCKSLNKPTAKQLQDFLGYQSTAQVYDLIHKYQCKGLITWYKSQNEKEIFDLLQPYNPNLIHSVRILDGKEIDIIDIYDPNQKIGLEYNEVATHCSIFPVADIFEVKPKDYHYQKMLCAEKQGIHLIQIWEDEYLQNKERMQKKILHLFNCNKQKKAYARQCKVVIPNKTQMDEFLNTNHIQGTAYAVKVCYGLEYEGDLVAVMTFAKNFRSKKSNEENLYELSRYATSMRVLGGFTKLVEHFRRNHPEVSGLYSFADRRFVSIKNNVYANNGWEIESIGKPDYTYCNIKTFERRHKSAWQRKNIAKHYPEVYRDGSGTEFTMMAEVKEWAINYDCGKIKYIKNFL